MIRRPPRSTLFPYPTLSDLLQQGANPAALRLYDALESGVQFGRSEEHTSELQSPCNLVCRLLLEKKKADSLPPVAIADDHLHLSHTTRIVDGQVSADLTYIP